jgi:hypothetical protein
MEHARARVLPAEMDIFRELERETGGGGPCAGRRNRGVGARRASHSEWRKKRVEERVGDFRFHWMCWFG